MNIPQSLIERSTLSRRHPASILPQPHPHPIKAIRPAFISPRPPLLFSMACIFTANEAFLGVTERAACGFEHASWFPSAFRERKGERGRIFGDGEHETLSTRVKFVSGIHS